MNQSIISPSVAAEIIAYVEAKKAYIAAWVNEDPENRMGGCTEPEWAIADAQKFGVQTFDDYIAFEMWLKYQDVHKDLLGYTPRCHWSDYSADEWQKVYSDLIA